MFKVQLQRRSCKRQRRGKMEKQRQAQGESVRAGISSHGCMKGCRSRPFRWITVAQLPFSSHSEGRIWKGEGEEANWFPSCLASAARSDSDGCLNSVYERNVYAALEASSHLT